MVTKGTISLRNLLVTDASDEDNKPEEMDAEVATAPSPAEESQPTGTVEVPSLVGSNQVVSQNSVRNSSLLLKKNAPRHQPYNHHHHHRHNRAVRQSQSQQLPAGPSTGSIPQPQLPPQQLQQQQQQIPQAQLLLQQQQQQHQQQSQQQDANGTNVITRSEIVGNTRIITNRTPSSIANSIPFGGVENLGADLQQTPAALLADRYILLDLLDGGSLYKCIDVKSKEEHVCKIAKNPCSNLLAAHFRLDGHPHINPLQKVIQGRQQTYLFFEPSQGDLHSHVRIRKRLREPEAKQLFRQMCETVKACHEQGIVLRDLKLRKFIFADEEKTQLRLESLEDAVVLDNPDDDLLQDKRGCPAYVSPEILKANTTYSGKAADMWSLGVILYTMLVGRYPFNDSEHASLFAKISRGHFHVPECLSSKARCMIRALLRRDPEERITSEDLLHHPWFTKENFRETYRSSSDQCVPIFQEADDRTVTNGCGLRSSVGGGSSGSESDEEIVFRQREDHLPNAMIN